MQLAAVDQLHKNAQPLVLPENVNVREIIAHLERRVAEGRLPAIVLIPIATLQQIAVNQTDAQTSLKARASLKRILGLFRYRHNLYFYSRVFFYSIFVACTSTCMFFRLICFPSCRYTITNLNLSRTPPENQFPKAARTSCLYRVEALSTTC